MRITPNQTMMDLAIMATGTIESVFQILAANGKGITDAPHVNDDYAVPADSIIDQAQLNYINQNGVLIGTGDDPDLYIGIGYWQIEVDFKVS